MSDATNSYKKIVFISGMAGYPWGGSEILWSRAASYLVKSGHSVLASVHDWSPLAKPLLDLSQQGVQISSRKPLSPSVLLRVKNRILGVLRLPRYNPSSFQLSLNNIRHFKPDVVCISHGGVSCGWPWMKWCHENSIPYISVAQANHETLWPSDELASALRDAYLHASACVFVSHHNKRLMEMQLGAEIPRAHILRNPVQLTSLSEVPWPSCDEVKLACVGRLDVPAKGQDLLLQVLAIEKWRKRELKVSFYGTGPHESSLKRLAGLLDVEKKVQFLGHVADVQKVWQEHMAIVLPSRFEGLPLAVVEAMICGRPAIVTDVAGNREVVTDNVTGFIAEAPTVLHLDEAMERAWNRLRDWPQIGQLAHQTIQPRYEIPAEQDLVNLILNTMN